MASILRQIVAGPRAQHAETGLDLCYVTDSIIATSGPSSTYPKKAYRNPTDQLVKFLDYKHGADWSIWEFRAEGTGYPDSEVYGRIHHFPWPDHHPPPFGLIPNLMASMRKWLRYEDEEGKSESKKSKNKRVAVVHCKAGKGRSGTVACSYLISEEGWSKEDALQRFTDRRMRVGFGAGVSIPSQLRWVNYVDRWANQLNKKYVERPVEIVEIHVFGLRDGVKVAVEGYVEEGRRIECFHIFNRNEKTVMDDGKSSSNGGLPRSKSKDFLKNDISDDYISSPQTESAEISTTTLTSPRPQRLESSSTISSSTAGTQTVLLRPSKPLILPTSDVNIDFERRNRASYTGFTMVTSVAHVWFNSYFEGGSDGYESGVFDIEWDAMDGIKGSVRKGIKALDRVKVLWRYAKSSTEPGEPGEDRIGRVISEPGEGEPVPEGKPTDWRGPKTEHEAETTDPAGGLSSGHSANVLTAGTYVAAGTEAIAKRLGLRKDDPNSIDVSRASSPHDVDRNAESPPSEKEHPYPHDTDSTMPAKSDNSISAAGFGVGQKTEALKTAELETAKEEALFEKNLDASAGRDRGHEPIHVQGPEGSEFISYEDGESEEEAIAPSNKIPKDAEGKTSKVGLGKVGAIVERLKSGGSEGNPKTDITTSVENRTE